MVHSLSYNICSTYGLINYFRGEKVTPWSQYLDFFKSNQMNHAMTSDTEDH